MTTNAKEAAMERAQRRANETGEAFIVLDTPGGGQTIAQDRPSYRRIAKSRGYNVCATVHPVVRLDIPGDDDEECLREFAANGYPGGWFCSLRRGHSGECVALGVKGNVCATAEATR